MTSPVALSTTTWINSSGVEVGLPGIGAAWRAGSNSAPWQGHTSNRALVSYPTRQPACVHTRLYATTLPLARRTSAAGPTPAAENPTAGPIGSLLRLAIL